MNDDDKIANVLGQVVEVGPSQRETELGAAVSRHVSGRSAPFARPDPEAVAALRSLGRPDPDHNVPVLAVHVDVNDLIDEHGEIDAYRILGQLKDLFGGTP